MSVLKRNRSESEIEFLNTSFELEKFTIQVCHRENVIPKRYRLTKGNDLMESAKNIGNAVVRANSIKVDSKEHYKKRFELQYSAIIELQVMLKDLRLISEVIPSIKDTVLEQWTGLILKEESLIKGWIKSDASRFSNLN